MNRKFPSERRSSLLLREGQFPEEAGPVAFQGSFLLVLKMLDAGGTIHKANKGRDVAAEKPFSFPGNSFCGDEESQSNNATFSKKKKKQQQLIHSITALNYIGR